MTVATLGIVVDSDSARKGAANLDLLPPAADRAEKSLYRMGNTTRSAAQQMRFLALQVPDVFQGLASGQSAMQVLVQQGGQVVQILQMGPGGIGGSLVRVKEAMLAMITPTRLLAAGLAGVGVAAVAGFAAWKGFALGLDDAARSSGIAQQEFSKMQAAASFKGIDSSAFQEGMTAFAKRVDDARYQTGELFKLFDANKVTITDTSTAFSQFADLIQNAKTDTERLYYLQLAGLPATMDWVRLLQGGSEALGRAKQEAESFAANEGMIQKAREFDEAWNQAWTNFKASSMSAIQSALVGLSSLSDAATGLLAKIPGLGGEAGIGANLLKAGQGTPLSQDTSSMYGGLLQSTPLKITVDPRSIKDVKEAKEAVDSLAESMRRLNEQRVTQLEKAQQETASLLSFSGASKSAALAQAELAKYRERNIPITPQLEQEINAWARQLAAVRELNQAIRSVKDSAVDFAQSLVSGLMSGQNLMQSLGSAAKSLGSSLTNSGIQNMMSGNLLLGGAQTAIGLVSSLFGNNQAKKQQQQQQMQQQLEEQQRAQKQAADDARRAAEQAAEEARREEERRIEEAKRLAERLAAVQQDAADREYAALNETETLSGRLADFDRKAAQEREASAREFGYVVVELERAQAAERSRIVKDSMQEQLSYYKNLRSTISDFVRGLDFGATSTLGPAEQFMAARNDFQKQLELAQGGDRTAQGNITSVAQTLLDQARSYLGPSAAFGELSDRIKAQLGSLTDIAMSNDSQIQELQRMGAYTGQLVQLQMANNESAEDIIAELSRMRLDLRQGLEAINLRAA